MALEAFLDSNNLPVILPVNGDEGILEAIISNKNEEHFDSMFNMANLGSEVLNSTILGRSSSSSPNLTLPAISNTTVAYPIPFSSDDPVNVSYNGDAYSHLCQAREKGYKRQKLRNTIGSTNLCKTLRENSQHSVPVRMEQEQGILAPVLKKPRLDVYQDHIEHQQQQNIEGSNPQLKAMMKQNRQQLRGFHMQIPKQQMEVDQVVNHYNFMYN